jgi:hypothetical protein
LAAGRLGQRRKLRYMEEASQADQARLDWSYRLWMM